MYMQLSKEFSKHNIGATSFSTMMLRTITFIIKGLFEMLSINDIEH
jgi:hypothetical protein